MFSLIIVVLVLDRDLVHAVLPTRPSVVTQDLDPDLAPNQRRRRRKEADLDRDQDRRRRRRRRIEAEDVKQAVKMYCYAPCTNWYAYCVVLFIALYLLQNDWLAFYQLLGCDMRHCLHGELDVALLVACYIHLSVILYCSGMHICLLSWSLVYVICLIQIKACCNGLIRSCRVQLQSEFI